MKSGGIGLALLGCVSALAYAAIAINGQSLHEEGSGGHSLLAILGLFALCFACYLAAIKAASGAKPGRTTLSIILGGALLFRGLLLFSDPIEEVDLYRYVWDGAASIRGVNPFRYAPQQVLGADVHEKLPDDLAKLVALRDRSPALSEVLARVHFGELPTIYPPVSQVVFALAAAMTPHSAGVSARMTIIKGWFVGFDLLTIVVLVKLLRRCGQADTAVVIYAWCPLVIKEFANSGHLDSLAVFLTTLCCWLVVKSLFASSGGLSGEGRRSPLPRGVLGAALVLGLAVGAKLYPVILAPILLWVVAARRGWRRALWAAGVFAATTLAVLYPIWPTRAGSAWRPPASVEAAEAGPPLPPEEIDFTPRNPSQSLRAFLSYWEMNDFLFLLVIENVRPTAHLAPHERAWFSIVPESWRTLLVGTLADTLGLDAAVSPFLFTRVLTSLLFLLLAGLFARRAVYAQSAADFLRYAFLTVAWFWLLLPTGNPWYWTWAMPLLPFARARAWLILSGLALLYYLRFWLVYHFADTPLLGTGYPGPWFFDYVITWLEFAPWLAALAIGGGVGFMKARAMYNRFDGLLLPGEADRGDRGQESPTEG